MDERRVEANAWNINWRGEALSTAAKTGDWKEFRRLFRDIKEFVEIIDGELQKGDA